MLLYIHDQLLIDEIQERFQECFSGLRIVFYSRIQNTKDPAAMYRMPGTRYVGDVRVKHTNGIMEIKFKGQLERSKRQDQTEIRERNR